MSENGLGGGSTLIASCEAAVEERNTRCRVDLDLDVQPLPIILAALTTEMLDAMIFAFC